VNKSVLMHFFSYDTKYKNQMILFPETLDEYIAENNPVRVIDVFIENLDVAEVGFTNVIPAKEDRPSIAQEHF
jgi:transposase